MKSVSKKEKIIIIILAVLIVIVAAVTVVSLVWSGSYGTEREMPQKKAKIEAVVPGKKEPTLQEKIVIRADGNVEKTEASAQESAESSAAETAPVDKDTILAQVDVENEVLRIRGIFNEIQGNLASYTSVGAEAGECYVSADKVYQKRILYANDGKSSWNREYYYENGKLIFAFYFVGEQEERFYFCDEVMFRWIDIEQVKHDKETGEADWLSSNVLKDGKGAYIVQ